MIRRTVNALKTWLRTKQLVVKDISAENSGYYCFFVSLKHGIVKNVVDTLKGDVVVTVGEILAMDTATLRTRVVDYAQFITNSPSDKDHEVLKVRMLSCHRTL